MRVFLLLMLACSLTGCGRSAPTSASLNKTNLDRLKNCYTIYLSDHGYNGPKDEQAFKSYLTQDPGAVRRLKRMEIPIEDIDQIFVSERDGEKFQIKYGVSGYLDHAVVFESKGVDGKRLVALSEPIEVDDASYDKYWNGKIKPTPLGSGNPKPKE